MRHVFFLFCYIGNYTFFYSVIKILSAKILSEKPRKLVFYLHSVTNATLDDMQSKSDFLGLILNDFSFMLKKSVQEKKCSLLNQISKWKRLAVIKKIDCTV